MIKSSKVILILNGHKKEGTLCLDVTDEGRAELTLLRYLDVKDKASIAVETAKDNPAAIAEDAFYVGVKILASSFNVRTPKARRTSKYLEGYENKKEENINVLLYHIIRKIWKLERKDGWLYINQNIVLFCYNPMDDVKFYKAFKNIKEGKSSWWM